MASIAAPGTADNVQVRWTLRLFGHMRLERSDGIAVRLPGRRERVLLAYLALSPELRATRRTLVTLLWGDGSDSLMLDNLRTCLWSLRKALGDEDHRLVVSERDWIGLDRALIDVDLWRFRDALAADTADELDHIVESTHGELLSGLDLDTETFEDWLRAERSRYADELVTALLRVAAERSSREDYDGALAASQRVLGVDPYNEAALRRMMGLYAATGRRHTALHAYQRFAEALKAELSVEPEAGTQALRDEIASGANGGTARPAAGAVAEVPVPAAPVEHTIAAKSAGWRARPLRLPLLILGGLVGVATGALLTVGVVFWRVPELAPAPFGDWIIGVKGGVVAGPPSIAVLPFRGYGEAGATEFADAISDGLTSALSIASEMLVVSRSSVLRFKDSLASPRDIARQLGVRYLLEGSATRFGDSMKVRAALIDTANGGRTNPVGEYEISVHDFYTLQQQITLEVVTALQVRLTQGEHERIGLSHGTRNFQAWLLASQGHKQLRQLTTETTVAARRSFEQALALDPDYTRALTGLAWTYLHEAQSGEVEDPDPAVRKAAALARRALALDDRRAGTYSLIGTVALFSARFDLARRNGERAVELEYNDSDAAALLALTLTHTGEPQRAITLVRRAIRLRPYSPRWYGWLDARAHRLAGKPREAVAILQRFDSPESASVLPLVELALAYSASGHVLKAREIGTEIRRRHPAFTAAKWARLPAYKDPEQSRREIAALRAAGIPE